MSDGTISSNTTNRSSSEGGGVGIINQGIFNKTGGTITGYTSDTDNGNVVRSDTGMVINNRGHAVYGFTNQGVVEKRKEVTAGPGVNLSFDGHTGTWSGNWDF
jgi:NADPH:quinone reductase-like Zn-dependent oxidoreductase